MSVTEIDLKQSSDDRDGHQERIMDEEFFKLIADGEILGFKRTSTFATFGSFAHTSATYDVFVDSASKTDAAAIREKVAGFLNTEPDYIRIVPEDMPDSDYPDHFRK